MARCTARAGVAGRGRRGAGTFAEDAWNKYKVTPTGSALSVTFQKITHPTYPESGSASGAGTKKELTKKMLQNWNTGLSALFNALSHRDEPVTLSLYGDTFMDSEKPEIPEMDFPAGLPAWMRSGMAWAVRGLPGDDLETKRRKILITIPTKLMPTIPVVAPHSLVAPGAAHALVLTAAAAGPLADDEDSNAAPPRRSPPTPPPL